MFVFVMVTSVVSGVLAITFVAMYYLNKAVDQSDR